MTALSETLSLEDIVMEVSDAILADAAAEGPPPDWVAFHHHSDRVHETFVVPSTTITPEMRRLLFALGSRVDPTKLVGIGTYVGYALCWLTDSSPAAQRRLQSVVAIDVDAEANRLARINLSGLGLRADIRVETADGAAAAATACPGASLVYIDVDHPETGKRIYGEVLDAVLASLPGPFVVLAHDLAHPLFAEAREIYEDTLIACGRCLSHHLLAVDECGLSVAVIGARHAQV